MKAAILMLLFTPLASAESLTEHTLKLKVGTEAARAELSQFEFLQGAWSGTGFGAECDEIWSAPRGESMLGTFRLVENGKLQFTEFFVLQKNADGGVELRLKHFHSDFKGWESRDKHITFPLIRVEKNIAYFGGLTYALQSDGSLRIWVAMKNKDAGYEEAAFHLQPAK
ncbi:MAG: DUF6265 family protein [Planctomycetota bacterium]